MKKHIRHLKKNDPVLGAIIDRLGIIEIPFREPTFEAMVRSIVFQQLSGKVARVIYERLKVAAGEILSPESILSVSEEQLRKCGLSRQKLNYIRDLASRTLAGEVNFQHLPAMSDKEVIEHLTRVKGIGVWSAQMFLMFALRRENVMPTGDLGIRTAIKKAYRKRKLPLPKDILKLARKWEPYCSTACYYLWRSLDNE
jgi:DNA-3-methyladenine glycosylase II